MSDTAYLDAQPDPALLGMLNVQYVISPTSLVDDRLVLRYETDDERLYENTAVLPRAYGIGTVEVVPDTETLWTSLTEVDPGQVALVEDTFDHELPAQIFFVPADSFEWHPNTIQVSITMPQDGFLVVSEVWTPGWRATDNGHDTQVVRVNGVLRGLFLDAGLHKVTFKFAPQTFYIGLVISLCTLIVCSAGLILSSRVDEQIRISARLSEVNNSL